jgi:hypothetical protein
VSAVGSRFRGYSWIYTFLQLQQVLKRVLNDESNCLGTSNELCLHKTLKQHFGDIAGKSWLMVDVEDAVLGSRFHDVI